MTLRFVMTILIMIIGLTALAAATIMSLNQIFALAIPHSPLTYVNLLFLMSVIRFCSNADDHMLKKLLMLYWEVRASMGQWVGQLVSG